MPQEQKLVIVESPKKAQLIQGFLKQKKMGGYKVMASAGHVRDLKKRPLGIDLENNYSPIYEVSEDKTKLVRELKSEAKKSSLVYLASDEDREGEAIAWHLSEALGLKADQRRRIVFHEITSEAFIHALENPRDIDQKLVDAQQARRVLDRLVGYELSPVLWRRVRPSLSAGRVQSVAVRLIVEREREIAAFVPTSVFRVSADFVLPTGEVIKAELDKRFATEEEAQAFLELCRGREFKITDLVKKDSRRSPSAPFTTSTLQQDAANRLGYSVNTTMRLAQSLYESGHITYMRTDSVNLSQMALATMAKQITSTYGKEYHQPRSFKTKSKGAQEAHEAIRPTYADRIEIEGTAQEKKLYELIRRRALASQMADARLERTTMSVLVDGTPYSFVAVGEVIKFRGFLEVYMSAEDDDTAKLLPPMQLGERLEAKAIDAEQRYSQRPARYTEASMVSKMEELGIGRPSTYAPTINTIQERGYVERGDKEGSTREVIHLSLGARSIKRSVKTERYGADKGKLIPTDMGMIVNDFLVEHFPDIVNYGFTAEVEAHFDEIAEGKHQWQAVIDRFYQSFHPNVEKAQTFEKGTARVGARELGVDPESGHKVVASMGRFGSMVQIGTTEEGVEKPRYASLRAGQSLEAITLEEALELFKLPKTLGEYEGSPISVGVGRFGPYVRVGQSYTSIPKGVDPLDLSLEEAIQLVKDKALAEEKSVLRVFAEEEQLEIRDGRYGAYIKYQGGNYKLPKNAEIASLTYEEVKAIIEQAPVAKTAKGKSRSTTAKASKGTATKAAKPATARSTTKRKTATK